MRAGRNAARLAVLLACACAPARDPDLELRRARNAIAQDRADWARLHFAKDLEQHPERLTSMRDQAYAWLSGYQQSLSTGSRLLAQYLERAPDDAAAARRLVRTQLALGQQEQALARALGLPSDAESELLRAQAQADFDLAAARAAADRALAQTPDAAPAHALAADLAERAGDLEQAARHAARAIALDPLQAQSLYRLGRLAQRRNDSVAAARYLGLHQRVTRLLHLGTLAAAEPAESLAQLDAIVRELGSTPELRKRRALLLFDAGRLGEAVELARELAHTPSLSTSDLLELATSAGAHGRRGDARALFEQALAQSPESLGAIASLALLEIEAGTLAAARARLGAALARDPDLARCHYLLARVERLEDHAGAAEAALTRALELAPWEWRWRSELCDLLLAAKQRARARALLDSAPEEAPGLAQYRQQHATELGPP